MLTGPWSVLVTVIFAVAGVFCLWRWTSTLTGPRRGRTGSAPAVELNHLVMCLAMVVMVWWPAGLVGTVVQIVVFGLLGLVFLVEAVRGSGVERVDAGAHLLMNAAMVWMLAAMPLLMGGSPESGASGGHHHGAAAATETSAAAPVPPPDWAVAMNWTVVIMVAAIALWWLIRAIRTPDHRLHAGCHAAMGVGMVIMLAALH